MTDDEIVIESLWLRDEVGDATLAALRRAIDTHPDEDTPKCEYIDRCMELGRRYAHLGFSMRTRLFLSRSERALVASLGVPSHLLAGDRR